MAEIDMQGFTMALAEKYDLLLVDIKLPDLDGNTICKRLWAESLTLPVLMLTSRKAACDKLVAFECGADDYVTKPFSMPELMARVGALLRRSVIT